MTSRLPDTCPHCGCEIEPPKKMRSRQQLNRVHALCEAAYQHWPQWAEFRPKSKEHLRYFLEVECGHFTVEQTITITDETTPDTIAWYVSALMKSSRDHTMFVEIDGQCIIVKRVGSIALGKLGHTAACALFADMDDVLHKYGLNAEQLLREAKSAA